MFSKRGPAKIFFRSGFTLFELLITIFIIVAVFFPLLTLLSSTLRVADGSKDKTIALNLARAKMEEIKSISFNQITAESKSFVSGYPGHKREAVVNYPELSLKNIKIYVYWKPSGGIEEHVSLESYISIF